MMTRHSLTIYSDSLSMNRGLDGTREKFSMHSSPSPQPSPSGRGRCANSKLCGIGALKNLAVKRKLLISTPDSKIMLRAERRTPVLRGPIAHDRAELELCAPPPLTHNIQNHSNGLGAGFGGGG